MQLKFEDLPQDASPSGPKAYTVSQIVQLVSHQLETRFGDIWVEGEVSNLRSPTSGHVYFTLKDARAQLAVVMFRSAVARLKFRLEDGQKLRCRGRLTIYDAQGRFQFTVEAAEPDGMGALQLAFEQLKRKLEAEGLFDPQRKKPLPFLPRTIAVVTSPTGAVLKDILRILHDRCPVRIVVCPTAVQGSDASAEIESAIGTADDLGADLIILSRGGGSLEDLWAFNTEIVARAISAARTPIISAVGHEIDITIADLVADRRAPTPSYAAELAVPVFADILDQLRIHRTRFQRAISQQLRERRLMLERLNHRLGTPLRLINRSRMGLDDASNQLEVSMNRRLAREHDVMVHLQARLAVEEPRARLVRHRAAIVAEEAQLVFIARSALTRQRSILTRTMARLEVLSPLAVLARGYCLLFDANRHVVRDIGALHAGDSLVLRLHQGEVDCTVDRIREDPEH